MLIPSSATCLCAFPLTNSLFLVLCRAALCCAVELLLPAINSRGSSVTRALSAALVTLTHRREETAAGRWSGERLPHAVADAVVFLVRIRVPSRMCRSLPCISSCWDGLLQCQHHQRPSSKNPSSASCMHASHQTTPRLLNTAINTAIAAVTAAAAAAVTQVPRAVPSGFQHLPLRSPGRQPTDPLCTTSPLPLLPSLLPLLYPKPTGFPCSAPWVPAPSATAIRVATPGTAR